MYIYIYTHTHTKRKRKRKRVVLLRDSYIHIPLYYYIGKRTKETRYFYKTRNSFRFPFRSYKTANKKDLFSPLSCLKEITKEFVPSDMSDCTFPLFFFVVFSLRVTSPKKKHFTTTRGVKTYSVSLCHAFFSLHRDVFVDVALPRKCDEKTRTKKRTTPHPSFLLRCNFR